VAVVGRLGRLGRAALRLIAADTYTGCRARVCLVRFYTLRACLVL
jgi:hypothetical protein